MLDRKLRDLLFHWTGYYVSRKSPEALSIARSAARQIGFTDLVATAVAIRPRGLRVLQVGACDGVSFDPIFSALAGTSAEIILVEPNSAAVDRLRRAYAGTPNVTIVQAAILQGEGTSEATLYRFSDELIGVYPDFGGTSSLSYGHMEKAFERSRHRFGSDVELADNVIEEQVQAMSPRQILKKLNMNDVDILVIDVESMDWIVLEGFLNAELRPKLIQFESRFLLANHIEAALIRLHSLGYILRDARGDTIAIRSHEGMQAEASAQKRNKQFC
jgi:FkbM family methyltransferase